MNTAATIGLLSLPQFYSTKQGITPSASPTVLGSTSGPSLVETDYKNSLIQTTSIPSLPIPTNNSQFIHQQNSQFHIPNSTQNQLILQNHYNNFQVLQSEQKDSSISSLTRSTSNTTSNLIQSNVNNGIMITNQQQNQPALIESLVQSVPNATSTPNPIQQQQQHDIFANLLLKFDPTSFFHKKHAMSDQIFNVSNLNGLSLNQMNTNTANINNGKMIINTLNDSKKTSSQNQQQNFIVEQQMKTAQLIQNQQNQIQVQQSYNLNSQQQHQQQQSLNMHQTSYNQNQPILLNNITHQQIHQIQLQQHQTQQQQHMQSHQIHNGMQNKTNETKLNESSNSSDDDHNSSGGGVGERPYKCSQCFKTFRKKVHLNQHCRIHSGERPYGCDYCEKRFTQLSHLWQHTRRHTGERPYKCDIGQCDKSFTQLSNLQSHLKTHGEKASASSQTINLAPNLHPTCASSTAVAAVLVSSTGHSQSVSYNDPNFHKQNSKLDRTKNQNKINFDKLNNSKPIKNSVEKGCKNKRHYCELCQKRFATEGVIRQHLCSKQQNISFLRNNEGSLILKALCSNSNLTTTTNDSK